MANTGEHSRYTWGLQNVFLICKIKVSGWIQKTNQLKVVLSSDPNDLEEFIYVSTYSMDAEDNYSEISMKTVNILLYIESELKN